MAFTLLFLVLWNPYLCPLMTMRHSFQCGRNQKGKISSVFLACSRKNFTSLHSLSVSHTQFLDHRPHLHAQQLQGTDAGFEHTGRVCKIQLEIIQLDRQLADQSLLLKLIKVIQGKLNECQWRRIWFRNDEVSWLALTFQIKKKQFKIWWCCPSMSKIQMNLLLKNPWHNGTSKIFTMSVHDPNVNNGNQPCCWCHLIIITIEEIFPMGGKVALHQNLDVENTNEIFVLKAHLVLKKENKMHYTEILT